MWVCLLWGSEVGWGVLSRDCRVESRVKTMTNGAFLNVL